MKKESLPSSESYSPFWGLALVFIVLLGLQGFTLRDNLARQEALKNSSAQLNQVLPNAMQINQTIEALSRDLIEISVKSEEAKKIVVEHNIKLNGGN